jgi:dihydroorotate dehydrogenase (fumarate)
MSVQLDCSYLTLSLKSPIIVGACSLTLEPESLRLLVACGAGAVVLPSIFQEQIAWRDQRASDLQSPAERSAGEDKREKYNSGPEGYLTSIQNIKQLVSIPVIASMNGYGEGEWLSFAQEIEASGADALELNLQPFIDDGLQSSEAIETQLCDMVRKVCGCVAIPVAVKLTARFTNIAHVARRLQSVGAAGVVLFAHEPRWDVALERLRWTIHWELTPVGSVGTTVAGIVHARSGGVNMSLAASGGIRSAEDAVKVMIAGADVVMMTSELYRAGPEAIRKTSNGLVRYLESNGFASLAEFQKARPTPETRSYQRVRRDYLEELTRSNRVADPTAVVNVQTGDRFGHRD